MSNPDIFSLKDRIIFISGGNSGIGLSIAGALKKAGGTVIISGRNRQRNKKASSLVDECLSFDIGNRKDVNSNVTHIIEKYGQLDVLINNAGIYEDTSILTIKNSWNKVLSTNLFGTLYCGQAAAIQMIKQKTGGKIINVGSMYSLFGHPRSPAYSTTKTAIIGLTHAMAAELGPWRIQVNAILPGWIRTPINGDLPTQQRGIDIKKRTPAGRWGDPCDLNGIAIFLSSKASDFISGAVIPVDGGYSISDRRIYD